MEVTSLKVAIFGGTGFIGRSLTQELLSNGYQVFVVSRNIGESDAIVGNGYQIIQWQNTYALSSINELKDIEVIINLSGESIGNRRWSDSVKQEIHASRIRTTKAIVSAINDGFIQPKVLINASAVGYYGPHKDEEITETGEAGQDFLAEVCRDWENEVNRVATNFTRVVITRIGVVIGNEGALSRMVLPFKFYFGGPLGTGKQWLSWIHIQDLTRLIRFVIEHTELNGPINATAPNPVTMRDFSNILGDVLAKPSWLPVPEFLLKVVLGQMSEMLLLGQRVVPQKAGEAGFEFKFPKLRLALEDVLKKQNSEDKD